MKIEQDRNNSSTADSSGNYHRISFLFYSFFPSCWCFHSTKKKAITNVDALLSVALLILFVLISGCILVIDSEAYGKWVHNCRPCIITCCIRCRRAFESLSQIRLIRLYRSLYLCRSLWPSIESRDCFIFLNTYYQFARRWYWLDIACNGLDGPKWRNEAIKIKWKIMCHSSLSRTFVWVLLGIATWKRKWKTFHNNWNERRRRRQFQQNLCSTTTHNLSNNVIFSVPKLLLYTVDALQSSIYYEETSGYCSMKC